MDYVECNFDVKDTSKLNNIVGFGTLLHKFTSTIGDLLYVPALSNNLP